MKRKLTLLMVPMLMVWLLVGCGDKRVAASEEPIVGVYTDGVYKGVGEGFKGDIKLSVKVEKGNITSIEMLEINESAGIGDVAIEEMIQKIIDAQSTEVDTVSQATVSSKGTIEAVEVALGLREAKQKQEESIENEGMQEEKSEAVEYKDGSYVGKAKGFHGDIEIKVDIQEGEIVNIDIISMDETAGIGDVAVEEIIGNVINKQSANVDAVSGATVSSQGTINAIKEILEEAKQ